MEWQRLVELVIPAVFAAGAAYAAVRVELRFLWRDVDRLHDRIEGLGHGGGPNRRRTDRAPHERPR